MCIVDQRFNFYPHIMIVTPDWHKNVQQYDRDLTISFIHDKVTSLGGTCKVKSNQVYINLITDNACIPLHKLMDVRWCMKWIYPSLQLHISHRYGNTSLDKACVQMLMRVFSYVPIFYEYSVTHKMFILSCYEDGH